MKLYYSTTSPYSRKVLILAYELEIFHSIQMMRVNPLENPPELRKENPLGKVPTLVLNDCNPIYDSPVIAEYLQRIVNKGELSIEDYISQQRLHGLADGIMDVTVSLVMEQRRSKEHRSPFWQERWEHAILSSIGEFERKYIDDAQEWHIGSIAMACALDYVFFRKPEIDWRQQHSKTQSWFEDIINKPSMIHTDPRQ